MKNKHAVLGGGLLATVANAVFTTNESFFHATLHAMKPPKHCILLHFHAIEAFFKTLKNGQIKTL